MNVTESPAQMVVGEAAMDIVGSTAGLTVTITCALVAVAGDTHAAVEVMTTHTESLLDNEDGV